MKQTPKLKRSFTAGLAGFALALLALPAHAKETIVTCSRTDETGAALQVEVVQDGPAGPLAIHVVFNGRTYHQREAAEIDEGPGRGPVYQTAGFKNPNGISSRLRLLTYREPGSSDWIGVFSEISFGPLLPYAALPLGRGMSCRY